MIQDLSSLKFFNDSMYGGIGVSKIETNLIDTPEFQRLRRLRQLGLVSYVFPCAEHTRFTHSLGTLMLMGKMTDHLRAHGWISAPEQEKLRIAALLHDIGHYPFSHLVEQVYMHKCQEETSFSHFLDTNSSLERKESLLTLLGAKVIGNGRKANHERLGAKVIAERLGIRQILIDSNIDPNEIGSIITGEFSSGNMIHCQLMHSSLDCDRLDYLPRDSFSTGVSYGLVDVEYLIRLLRKGSDRLIEDEVIGIDARGQNVVEHYLMARFFHYSKVIGHKTIRAFECVAKAAIYLFLEESKAWPYRSYEQLLAQINTPEFLRFDDSYLMHCMEQEASDLSNLFQVYFNVVKNRVRPRVLYEIRGFQDAETEKYSNMQYNDLHRELSENPNFIADAMELPRDYVGWQEAAVTIEGDPFLRKTSPSFEKDDLRLDKTSLSFEDEDKYREAVRLIDRNNNAQLLVSNEYSIINKLARHKSVSFIIFYIENPSDTAQEAEDRFKRGQSAIKECIKD